VIAHCPTVLDVDFMWLFISLGIIMVYSSTSTNMFDSMSYQVHLRKVAVAVYILDNIFLVADRVQAGVHFTPILGWCPSFGIYFLADLSLVAKFRC
jgi:hypothetical protein